MEFTIKIICWCVALLFSIFSMSATLVKSISKKKVTVQLTLAEQEQDLHSYMVSQTIQVESFSKIIKNSMTKDELSNYKRNTVMSNITLYAKANGYNWYNTSIWEAKLNDYVKAANATSGKLVQDTIVNSIG